MRTALPIVAVVLALAGCAGLGKETAPACDGKHRRPANPYGSVLDPAAPPTAAKPDRLSALAAAPRSCGE
ncbi:MAG: hypothetical protein GC203_13815 [Phenylobacterium sp.]|uniref:hypothetical protein n=1 Tax=Phenylobacterium sp. TaxID=1871053 RepID=UPI0025F931D7|nr:hypothetical protein [Phenylobacterium sp.]MBI1198933.1 hypothetical protein [Phenylobacterium sp.]